MLEGILKGLLQWLYGLFLELISYCADSLLKVMSTDLTFFENSVPIVITLYKVFVAIGWGLLIGNLAFQSMKAMFAGFGFETESPAIMLLRTFLFGTLLIFSKDICDIGLSLGKNVIDLLGVPTSFTVTFPNESFFTGGASWLLVIIIGLILGFQLIKLFFEIAERYVVVGILTLLCPVGLAMGGSKATKDICTGFMRMYASMIVMMVLNVLFLKLILSALASMPSGLLVLPWCLLVVGLAKTARKVDNMVSKIGLNPATTGDPLGTGRGLMLAAMAARTIMYSSARGGRGLRGGNAKSPKGNVHSNTNNSVGGTNVNGSNVGGTNVGGTNIGGTSVGGSNSNTFGSSSQNVNGGNVSNQSNNSTRFGGSSYTGGNSSGRNTFSTGGTKVNSSRYGSTTLPRPAQSSGKGKATTTGKANGSKAGAQSKSRPTTNRFGSNSGIKHNPNPMRPQSGKAKAGGTASPKSTVPNIPRTRNTKPQNTPPVIPAENDISGGEE